MADNLIIDIEAAIIKGLEFGGVFCAMIALAVANISMGTLLGRQVDNFIVFRLMDPEAYGVDGSDSLAAAEIVGRVTAGLLMVLIWFIELILLIVDLDQGIRPATIGSFWWMTCKSEIEGFVVLSVLTAVLWLLGRLQSWWCAR